MKASKIRIRPPSGDERLQPMVTTLQKIIDRTYPKAVFSVRSYGVRGDGREETRAMQAVLDEAARHDHAEVRLDGARVVVKTLHFDARNISIVGPGALIAHSSIPDDGAIILSLAGGSDTTVNQALLDGIYGSGVQSVRSKVPNSMEGVVFSGIEFVGNSNEARAFHMTGFTRACSISRCRFSSFKGATVCINGSWSYSLFLNLLEGNGTDGFGFQLGTVGNGERSGATVCNAVTMIGNEITGYDCACEWDYGAGGFVGGNIFEHNADDGFRSQSVTGVTFTGNYLEGNPGDSLSGGGTNGVDYLEGWLIAGNYFHANSGGGNRIRIQAALNCEFGYNEMGGTKTQWYFIPVASGPLIQDCKILIPGLTSTYVTNPTSLRTGYNDVRAPDGLLFRNVQNGNFTTTHAAFASEIVKVSGGGGETITIDSQANVSCRRGSKIRIRNLGGGTLTVAVASDVLALAGAAAGNRTIANMGVFEAELMLATADGDATDTWVASGQGVT